MRSPVSDSRKLETIRPEAPANTPAPPVDAPGDGAVPEMDVRRGFERALADASEPQRVAVSEADRPDLFEARVAEERQPALEQRLVACEEVELRMRPALVDARDERCARSSVRGP